MLVNAPPGDRILTIKQVAVHVGLAQSTLEQHIRQGKFPQPLKLTAGKRPRIGWLASTVEAHVATIAAAAERATAQKAVPAVSAAGHLELRFAREDRAAVAVRRLQRYGFRCRVQPSGALFACAVDLEHGSVPGTLEALRVCVQDVLRIASPVFVPASGEAGDGVQQDPVSEQVAP